MTESLIENVKLAINAKFQDWVLFQNGSYIIFDNTDTIKDIKEEAIKLMKEFGPVYLGTPAGDCGVTKLNKTEGWSISGHFYGMYTYVNPSELNSSKPADDEIGIVGRSKRNLDGQNPIIIHVNRKDLDIKLIAGFVGIKRVPLHFVLGYNNLNPKLILRKDHFEHSGIFFGKIDLYENIDKIDIFFSRKTTNIVILKIDSIFTFVGNTNSYSELRKILAFLKEKECLLTQKALDFIEK